jgi:hypothetical protein
MTTITAATAVLNSLAKGDQVTLILADSSIVTGTFVSINSKGVNLNVDGKVTSRAMSRIASVITTPEVSTPADLFTDEGVYGAADLAAKLDMDAYDVRVILRDLGYGVGKGRKYALDLGDANNALRGIRNTLATQA